LVEGLLKGRVVDRLVSLESGEGPCALVLAQERMRSIYESELGEVFFIDVELDTQRGGRVFGDGSWWVGRGRRLRAWGGGPVVEEAKFDIHRRQRVGGTKKKYSKRMPQKGQGGGVSALRKRLDMFAKESKMQGVHEVEQYSRLSTIDSVHATKWRRITRKVKEILSRCDVDRPQMAR
jgi:hypothetical protein